MLGLDMLLSIFSRCSDLNHFHIDITQIHVVGEVYNDYDTDSI